MKFENLISHPQDLIGKTIKHIRAHDGGFIFITEDNSFTFIMPEYEAEDDYSFTKLLPPANVFWALKRNGQTRAFLKRKGVIDFEEFERLVENEKKEALKKMALKKIEDEKRLLAELKAKYE